MYLKVLSKRGSVRGKPHSTNWFNCGKVKHIFQLRSPLFPQAPFLSPRHSKCGAVTTARSRHRLMDPWLQNDTRLPSDAICRRWDDVYERWTGKYKAEDSRGRLQWYCHVSTVDNGLSQAKIQTGCLLNSGHAPYRWRKPIFNVVKYCVLLVFMLKFDTQA
jgi:hypothetical protein